MVLKRSLGKLDHRLRTHLDERRRHLGNKNQASHILSVLAEHGHKLSDLDRRTCRDYAADVLGNAKYEYWLRVFCAVNGEFKSGWIPDDYYLDFVVPRWNGEPGRTSYSKSISNDILKTPLLPDVLIFINGLFVTPSGHTIPEEQVKSHLFAASERIVFKADNSIQGRGISILDQRHFDLSFVKPLGNGVFQCFVNQHPDLDKYAPGVASTLRLTTTKDDNGIVTLRGAILRLGRTASQYLKSKEQLAIAVNVETGEMDKAAVDPNFIKIKAHPDTGEPFDGGIYPEFEAAKQAVLELHETVSLSRCIGWDVVVDDNQDVKIIEWNGYYNGLRGHEAMQGPVMLGLGWEHFWKEAPLAKSQHTLF
ncbi:MAG: hypothetical protein Hens2KO_21170 [Henriciella sp.]